MTKTVGKLLDIGCKLLANVSDTPKLDSSLLIAEVLAKSREWLVAHTDESVGAEEEAEVHSLFSRRQNGEPIAYIRGYQPFWKPDFVVTRDTLIPRPDTELIVEIILSRFSEDSIKVADLGTGSGALAVSLGAERSKWKILGIDISESALSVAKQNAGELENVRFSLGSWFSNVKESFDLIISNPPYVRSGDRHLTALKFEPTLALAAGEDGLECYRQIIKGCNEHIIPGGYILFEHGYEQQRALEKLLLNAGFIGVEGFKDLHGQPRAVIARRPL